MASARGAFTATLLRNGKVLVTGGLRANGTALSGAELYDPAANCWTAAGSMSGARAFHTATLVGSGKVLVAGGVSTAGGTPLASAELYDPSSNSWTSTTPMRYPRARHTATLLDDGTVLIAGGIGTSPPLLATEIFNPAGGTWAGGGNLMEEHPDGATAVRLSSGQVLLFGGTVSTTGIASGNTVEGFTESAGWAIQQTYPPGLSRNSATATVLSSGSVLVAGGEPSQGDGGPLTKTDLYNPQFQSWKDGSPAHYGHCGHTATLLNNGAVLVAGGYCGPPVGSVQESALNKVESYEVNGDWTDRPPLTTARGFAAAVLLNDGKVLIAGGFDSTGAPLHSVEVYTP